VFAKVNSPSDPYASKAKLRSLSFLRISILLRDLFCPLKLFAPEPPSAGIFGECRSSHSQADRSKYISIPALGKKDSIASR
jgi:hypothetical protein